MKNRLKLKNAKLQLLSVKPDGTDDLKNKNVVSK